jgi:hypothetical protein
MSAMNKEEARQQTQQLVELRQQHEAKVKLAQEFLKAQ